MRSTPALIAIVLFTLMSGSGGGEGALGVSTGPASDDRPVSTDSEALAHCRNGTDAACARGRGVHREPPREDVEEGILRACDTSSADRL